MQFLLLACNRPLPENFTVGSAKVQLGSYMLSSMTPTAAYFLLDITPDTLCDMSAHITANTVSAMAPAVPNACHLPS